MKQTEAGYALVTAVVAMGLLAAGALAMTQAARGTLAGAGAELDRARLDAGTEAGTAIAIAALSRTDRTARWSPDGRPRGFAFAGLALTVRVEDERGKVPLNQITDEQVRALLEAAGAGDRLEVLTDAFLDWRDDDDEVRPDGAELGYYEPRGRFPRNGALRTIDELADIRGFDPALIARLRPLVSVYSDQREGFDDRFASPEALTVMSGGGPDSPQAIERARERAGQRVAIELAPAESLNGRPLTIRVTARDGHGGASELATIVQLTGAPSPRYIVRQRG